MINLSLHCCLLNSHKCMQYINLSDIVHVLKAVGILTSVHLN